MVDSGKHTFKVGDRVRFFRKSRSGKYKYGTVLLLESGWVKVKWDACGKTPAVTGSTMIRNIEPATTEAKELHEYTQAPVPEFIGPFGTGSRIQ